MELSPIPLKDAEPTWSRVSRYIVFNKEGILKKYSNPVYIPLKDVEGDGEVLNPQKVSKKKNKHNSKVFWAQKTLDSFGKRAMNKSNCAISREDSLLGASPTPVSLQDPRITLPKRRNESLFTPVARLATNKNLRNSWFTLEKGNFRSINSMDMRISRNGTQHLNTLPKMKRNYLLTPDIGGSITEDMHDLSTSGKISYINWRIPNNNIGSNKQMNISNSEIRHNASKKKMELNLMYKSKCFSSSQVKKSSKPSKTKLVHNITLFSPDVGYPLPQLDSWLKVKGYKKGLKRKNKDHKIHKLNTKYLIKKTYINKKRRRRRNLNSFENVYYSVYFPS